MGLDMYLSAKLYVSNSEWDKEENDQKKLWRKIQKAVPDIYKSGNINFIDLRFEVGCWRKANAIHKWFVNNVQDEKDDGGSYWVSREDLEELRRICKRVIASSKLVKGQVYNGETLKDGKWEVNRIPGKIIEDPSIAKAELPTRSGFFFGNTEYDEGYIFDLKNTVKIIDRCLKLPDIWSFEYRASW